MGLARSHLVVAVLIVPDFQPPPPKRVEVSRRHVDAIVQGLWAVVNDEGTGIRARLPGHDVCGKTGSAQRASRKTAAARKDLDLRDSAWFVGFTPCREPELVVTALFESGEHGHLAAPIVRDVIKSHLDKKRRIEWALQATRPRKGQERDSAAGTVALARTGQP